MIRGLRNSLDFNYEKDIANMNHSLNDDITTLFIMSNPEFSHISSTLIKDIMKNSGDISPFIPEQIKISNIN
jgi:pantetheine-phosphate adenylyltransferase